MVLWRPGPTVFQGYTTHTHSQAKNTVLLTNGLVASAAGSNAKSATLQVYADDTAVYNIDVENSYGTGGVAGAQAQALALCQAGARNGYYSSGFYSFQARTALPLSIHSQLTLVVCAHMYIGHGIHAKRHSLLRQCVHQGSRRLHLRYAGHRILPRRHPRLNTFRLHHGARPRGPSISWSIRV